ncbi:putative ATPase [Mesorhizobium sp. J18]|uniref:AAA family ATPase n=1 Tax=Mesorhizobium sp. J18 TaxID=935263 RepID=UPI001199FE6F|nr:AAA family ATPase [Mesorhizobium sp. J18]TWG90666.1 putative ATPase [Mesorhizobium sp. J18]
MTGGPGSGKTALLDALRCRGFATMPEAGRAIITEQDAIGGPALPWSDRRAFAELMLNWEMRSYREAASTTGTVFFDRGVPDVIGYLRLSGLDVPPHALKAAATLRYSRSVFIAAPWRGIFRNDAERKQSFEEAEATFRAMERTYREFGYELVHLPLAAVEERVRFVLGHSGSIPHHA